MFTVSGVAFEAAMIRSPSFSRFSSSVTITSRPSAISWIADSTVSNGGWAEAVLMGRAAERLWNVLGCQPCHTTGTHAQRNGSLHEVASVNAWRHASARVVFDTRAN